MIEKHSSKDYGMWSFLTVQATLVLVPTMTSSWHSSKLTWRRVSSLSDYNSSCCRFDRLSHTHLLVRTFASFTLQNALTWFVSAGQPCFTCPIWTGWFLLFGRVGATSGELGRARSSEADFWKGETVLHRCCHSTKPWGGRCWKSLKLIR